MRKRSDQMEQARRRHLSMKVATQWLMARPSAIKAALLQSSTTDHSRSSPGVLQCEYPTTPNGDEVFSRRAPRQCDGKRRGDGGGFCELSGGGGTLFGRGTGGREITDGRWERRLLLAWALFPPT